MSGTGDGEYRTVEVLTLGDADAPAIPSGTDVAVLVLNGRQGCEPALLADVRDRVEVVMGIVLGSIEETSGPALASLREVADIIAHAGGDDGIVDDVVATLAQGHPRPA